MLALGSCIAGIGILVTGLLALLFRNPNAPRWTRPEIVPMLLCVPVTATTGLGLGYVAYGASRLVKGIGDPRELLVLAGVVIVLVLLWRVSRIPGYGGPARNRRGAAAPPPPARAFQPQGCLGLRHHLSAARGMSRLAAARA
jgi:hypothetical protein